MDSRNNKAIMLSDRGELQKWLTYAQIYDLSDRIVAFLSTLIRDKHQCLGLKMTHNLYVPSIVLSLQKLQLPFIFLTENGDESDIVRQLGIGWILSFNSRNSVAGLDLQDEKLTLEKRGCETKCYKDVFYIIRTSGTTGATKFVKVGKRSIESNIKSLTRIFDVHTNDVIYFGTPLTFDPSMVELLLSLHNGACLLIAPHGNPDHLHQTLFHPLNGVTMLQTVPSVFLRWSQQQIQNVLLNSKLRVLAFGGEDFPASVLQHERADSLRIFNLYGVTELSCWATMCEVKSEVSLGAPLDDTLVEVRDGRGNRVLEGEGEVYIGSKDRICWVDDEVESPRFRATGDIAVIGKEGMRYRGRKNDTFKRFGHRIHLSWIEEMVHKETGLLNKCVWSKAESKLLLFFIIADYDVKVKEKILDKARIKLLHGLPKQCFPDYLDIIRKCPVTSHGKANVTALENIYFGSKSGEQKSPPEILKSLLSTYLGLGHDSYKKTFFELGGNSILAVQLLTEFADKSGSECPDLVTALFEKDIEACVECTSCLKSTSKRPSSYSDRIAKKAKQGGLKVVWSYNMEACVDSPPLVFTHKQSVLVAVGSFSRLFAVLDAATGEPKSKFLLPDVIEAQPSLSPCGNYLYVGCFDGNMYCLDFLETGIKWVYSTGDRIKCTPVGCQNLTAIVFGGYDGHVHCINGETGSPIWKTSVEESVTSTPLLHQGKIYVATICGTCLCLLEPDGEILWKYKTGSPIFGSPCTVNDAIVWPKVLGSLLCMSTDGRKIHELDCGGHIYSSLVARGDTVIFGCHDRCLYFVDYSKGSPAVETAANLNDCNLTTPCVYRSGMVVAGKTGGIFLTDFSGSLEGELQLPGEVFSSVVAHEGRVFVGCRDNNLYCIEIKE